MRLLLTDGEGRLVGARALDDWRAALQLPALALGMRLDDALAAAAAAGADDAAALRSCLKAASHDPTACFEHVLVVAGAGAQRVQLAALPGQPPGAAPVLLQLLPAPAAPAASAAPATTHQPNSAAGERGTALPDAAPSGDTLARLQQRLAMVQAVAAVGGWDHVPGGGGEPGLTPEIHRVIGHDPASGPLTVSAFFRHVHPEDLSGLRADRRRLDAGEPLVRSQFRYCRDDGRTIWLEARVSPVAGAGPAPARIVGTLRDVTETVHLQSELERQRSRMEALVVNRTVELAAAREHAEAANSVQGEFLTQASHDIRTPLNAIVSLVHLMRRGPLDPEQQARARAVDQAAQRLSAIVDQAFERAGRSAARPPPSSVLAAAPQPGPTVAPPPPLPADARAPLTEAARRLRHRHPGQRVLLAEDDPISQAAMTSLLADAGLQVDTADDGRAAVAKAADGDYALIVLDLRMPHLGGLEAARAIRQLAGHRRTPMLAISAHAFAEDRKACAAAGFDDFLPKPVEVGRMYELLLGWLDHPPAAGGVAATGGDGVGVAQALQGVEGIDAEHGLASVGGKPAVYRRLLAVFIQTHATDGERVMQLLDDGQRDAAAQLAHRLRGSAATLGLIDVETAAGELEHAVDDGVGADRVEPLGHALDKVLQRTLRSLQQALPG